MLQALPPNMPPAIIVTGRALPGARAERVYGTELIDRRRIRQAPSHALDQLLKDVPGVQLFRRSDSHSGHPTSQGVTLRALGGNASSRALLMLDGVPQGDPFGGWINWPAYDATNLAGIRIVRGGGSVGNGPGALAGTIEMTSRIDTGVSGEIHAGSRDAMETIGRVGIKAGDGVLSLGARLDRGDGFIPITNSTRGPADAPAPYSAWNSRARLVTSLVGTTELQANISGFHDWRTRGTDFSNNRTNGADASLRLVGRGDWQWAALGYWQWRNLKSSFASVGPGRAVATRVSLQDSVPSRGFGGSFELRPPMPRQIELRVGADARRTTGESRELYSYVAGEPTRRRLAGGESWTGGVFTEASLDSGRATVTGGARIDHWQISDGHLFERVIASGQVLRNEEYGPRGGWLPTGRAGINIDFGSGISGRSATYLGWRMPTLNELFRPFRAGLDATAANPHLDPERLTGVEAGVDYRRGAASVSLTGFLNRLNDAIANVTLGKGPGVFPGVGFVPAEGVYRQRQTVGAVRSRGLEATAQWSTGPWAIRAGASFTHARMQASGAALPLDGLRPAQTPDFAATLSGGWEKDGRSAELVVRRVGRQFEDDLNTRPLDGATTIDATFSWPLSKSLQIVVRGENLTNALVMAGIGGDGAIERATPRTLWVGVRLR